MSEEQTALTFEPCRTAIVVIDLQEGIARVSGGVPRARHAVVANCARLLIIRDRSPHWPPRAWSR
jgi:nicotinamidase-related amidase